jgi:uncharacterized membrane protein YhaH (DUF805 family)
MNEYLKMWKHGFSFAGRSTRKDYWMAVLFNIIFAFVVGMVAGIIDFALLSVLYTLAVIIPGWTLAVRRLHDINKSGWFLLISLIPVVGSIVLLVFYCLPSVEEDNQYGEILE